MREVTYVPSRSQLDQLAAVKGALLDAARRDRRVTDLQFRIYSEAVSYVHRSAGDKFGTLWPAIGTIAHSLNTHPRTVQRAMRDMLGFGYLELVSPGGGRRS